MSGTGPGADADAATRAPFRDRVYASYVSRFKGRPEAEEEAAHLERHARALDHVLAPLLRAPRPEAVLEIGCGAGHFLHWARTRGFRSAEGVDASPEQVALARERGLPATAGDAAPHLAARPGRYDAIVAMDVIEHLTREEGLRLLDHCFAALRPGGRILLTTPNGAGWRPGPVFHGDLTHETCYTPSSLRTALALAGFEAIRVAELPPPPVSLRARVRGLLWRLFRLVPLLVDVVETGGAGDRVFTRVMRVEARRPG